MKKLLIVIFVFLFSAQVLISDDKKPDKRKSEETPTYFLNKMETEGIISGSVGKFKMKIEIDSLVDEWQRVPLFTKLVSLIDYKVTKGGSDNLTIIKSDSRQEILIRKKGSYIIEVEFAKRVEGETVKTISVPSVNSVKGITSLTFDGKDLRVKVEPDTDCEISTKDGKTQVKIYGSMAGEWTISWSSAPLVEELKPVLFGETKTLIDIAAGTIKFDIVTNFRILQGKVNSIQYTIPSSFNITNLEGDYLRSWDSTIDGANKILILNLSADIKKEFEIKISLEQTAQQVPFELEVPDIRCISAERESGIIAITLKSPLKVDVSSLSGLTQIDTEMVKDTFRTSTPIAIAYSHIRKPFILKMTVSETKPRIFAEVFHLVRLSRENMHINTSIKYNIRDSGIFSFDVFIDKDLKLISVDAKNINNRQLKDGILTVNLRTKAIDSFVVNIEMTKELETEKLFSFPMIKALNTESETGFIAFMLGVATKLEIFETKDLIQVNPAELPGIEKLKDKKVEFAFTYFKHPYSISLRVDEQKPEVIVENITLMKLSETQIEAMTILKFEIKKEGIFSIQIETPKDASIKGVTGDNVEDWRLLPDKNLLIITLRSKVINKYTLNIGFQMSISDITKAVKIPTLTVKDTKRESGVVALKSTVDYRLKTDFKNVVGIFEVDMKDLPQEVLSQFPDVSLAYRFPSKPWTLSVFFEFIQPKIQVETFELVSVFEDRIAIAGTAWFDIHYSSSGEFAIKFPKGAENIKIDGQNIKRKDKEFLESEQREVWRIYLHSKILGKYPLYFSFEWKTSNTVSKFTHTGTEVLNIERQNGYLVLTARQEIELGDFECSQEMTPIDERDIPENYRREIFWPILSAFRYVSPKYSLSMNIIRHDFAKVLVAVIEKCKMTTYVTRDGIFMTDMTVIIRNVREQYFEIKMPKEVEIMHVLVDGQKTIFLQQSNKEKIKYKIPIATQQAKEIITVHIRFNYKTDKISSYESLRLELPETNLPLIRLGWTIIVPDEFELITSGGNMEKVEYLEPGLAQIVHPNVSIDKEKLGVYIPNKQGNLFMWNIQNDLISEPSSGEYKVVNGKAEGTKSVYTGGSEPFKGKSFNFQRLISLDEPCYVTITIVSKNVGVVSKAVLGIICVVILLIFLKKTTLSESTKLLILSVVFGAVLSVSVLSQENYAPFISLMMWVIIIMMVVYSLMILISMHPQARNLEILKGFVRLKEKIVEQKVEVTQPSQIPPEQKQ